LEEDAPPPFVSGSAPAPESARRCAPLGLLVRNPVWIAIGVVQPLLYLILFTPLLKSIASMPGFPPGGAYNVFVPGLLIQLGLFGGAGVGFALIAELRAGVVERMRVTPVSRVACCSAGGSGTCSRSSSRRSC
jgi:hypothetical protein